MDLLLYAIFIAIGVFITYFIFKPKVVKDTRTEAQKEYDNFMDKSGGYDDDEEDILRNRQWRERVYGK